MIEYQRRRAAEIVDCDVILTCLRVLSASVILANVIIFTIQPIYVRAETHPPLDGKMFLLNKGRHYFK